MGAPPESAPLPPPNRRSFFAVAAAVATGAIAVLTPLGAGLASFFTPLFRKSSSSRVRIALLEQVPDDGVPRAFPVLADRVDAWTRYPEQRIGAVYLIRNKGEEKPIAFTAKCPHAGCFIGYTPGKNEFKCPCHTSEFKLDGTRVHGDAEVAPRGMDRLEVELRTVGNGAAGAGDGRGLRVRRRQRQGQGAPELPPPVADGKKYVEVWVDYVDYQTGLKERVPTG